MKNFISKIRNKRLEGNVSLLIIFILLAGSVIALLSINQIQRLLTYGNMTFNYFRAFYIAKAGTELGLTEVYHREAGFQQTINSGDAIVTNNLVGIYTGFDPYFEMDIEGNFKYLAKDIRYTDKCDDDNRIVLGTGEGIMISLFRDVTSGFGDIISDNPSSINKLGSDIENIGMDNLVWDGGGDKKFTFGLFSYNSNGDMDNIIVNQGDNLNSFLRNNISKISGDRRYLTIKNPSTGNSVASFCIDMGGELVPYSDFLITVQANYSDMEVGLQSVVKNEIPSWSLNLFDDPK